MLETELTTSPECNNPARFEEYFHDSVSKANLVVHNHFSDVVFGKYLLMSLYHILSDSWCFMVLTELQVSAGCAGFE